MEIIYQLLMLIVALIGINKERFVVNFYLERIMILFFVPQIDHAVI